jgi:hypothetical protein
MRDETCKIRLSRQSLKIGLYFHVACPAPIKSSPRRRFRQRINLHGPHHAGPQADAIRYLIDVDAHRHVAQAALR